MNLFICGDDEEMLFWLYNIGIAMVDRARGGDGAPPAAVSQR